MTADLKTVKTFKSEVQDDVVRRLEQLLASAKAGEIEGFAAALVYADGDTGTAFTMTTFEVRLAGAIATLQFQYHAMNNGDALEIGMENV